MQRDDLPDPGLPPGFDRWLEVGPVRAPDGLLEASMRPLPRLRRRGAWRIRLARLTPRPPAVALAGVVIVLAVVGGLATGFPNVGPGAQPSLAPDRGGFALELSGARSGRWLSDPRAALLTCVTPDAGPWVFQYAGGDPFVSIDVVVPDGATTEPGSERVAAEIEFADGPYVRFDPAGIRGGDPEGRSTASVVVRTTGTAASFTVDSTTPDRTLGVDGASVVVLLTVYCPQ